MFPVLSHLRRVFSAARRACSGAGAARPERIRDAVSAEPLESRILFALASLTGGGCSGTLSTNPSIRQQQLICDPATPSSPTSSAGALDSSTAPSAGFISVSYDPNEVNLQTVAPAPGYVIDFSRSLIEVQGGGEGEGGPEGGAAVEGGTNSVAPGTFAEPLADFLPYVNEGSPPEAGKLDIYFSRATGGEGGTPGVVTPPEGYTNTQEAGPLGFDNCILTFQVKSNVPLTAPKYTVFADPNALGGGDFLATADGTIIPASAITPATVGGPPPGLSIDTSVTPPILVVGDNAAKGADLVQISPVGASKTGSTGIAVQATLGGKRYAQTYTTPVFSEVAVVLQDANANVSFAPSLTLSAFVTAGNGNDRVSLGAGTNTVVLGDGNDHVFAAGGTTTLNAGDGNDIVQLLGGGNNTVTLGNGNDSITAAGGGNFVTAGNGNDNVNLGNGGFDAVILGNGNDKIVIGSGSFDYVSVGSFPAGDGKDTIQIGAGNYNSVYYFGVNTPRLQFGPGTGDSVNGSPVN